MKMKRNGEKMRGQAESQYPCDWSPKEKEKNINFYNNNIRKFSRNKRRPESKY